MASARSVDGDDDGLLALRRASLLTTNPRIDGVGPLTGDAIGTTADRRRAAALAGHRNDPDAARRFLDDPDGGVRATALGALHRASALRTEDLAAALADSSSTVRSRAAELVAALEGRGPAEAVSLLGLLTDPDDTVVEIAAWASSTRAGSFSQYSATLPSERTASTTSLEALFGASPDSSGFI